MAAAGTSSFVQVSRPLYPAVLFSLTRVHRSEGGKQFVFLSRRVRCPNRLSPLTTLPVRPAAQRYPSSISVTQCVQYSPLILFAPTPTGALCFRSKVSAQIRIKERGCSSSERRACSFLVSGFSLSRAPYEAKKKRTKKKSCLGAPMRRETKIKRSHPRSSIKVRSRDQRPATSLVFFLLRLSSKLRITTEEEIEKNISEVDGPGHTELVGNCTI